MSSWSELKPDMVESWPRKAAGSSETTTWPTVEIALALVAAQDRVGDLVADGLELVALALLVGPEGREVLAQLGEVELGVVVSLRRLLGLVVEPVDLSWTSLMSGSAWAGETGTNPMAAMRRDSQQGAAESHPVVIHERVFSLVCRTSTG